MKIVVIGAGSVGLAIAATAVTAGIDVCIVTRGKSVQALQAEGIRVTGVLGEHSISADKLHILEAQTSLPVCDAILVATKAAEVSSALQSAIPEGQAKCPPLLLVQNGWGSAQQAKEAVPPGTPIFSASLMTGIERLSPTEVKVNGHNEPVLVGSLFGDDPAPINPLIDLLQKGFLPFAQEPLIEIVLLKKLLFSLCLNPLSALLKATYGQLRESDYAGALMENLAGEALKTITATREVVLYKDGADYVRNDLIPKRISKNSMHRSSMLQDIEAGRRTEINYINGAISKMGRERGIPTPCNDIIVGLILAMEDVALI